MSRKLVIFLSRIVALLAIAQALLDTNPLSVAALLVCALWFPFPGLLLFYACLRFLSEPPFMALALLAVLGILRGYHKHLRSSEAFAPLSLTWILGGLGLFYLGLLATAFTSLNQILFTCSLVILMWSVDTRKLKILRFSFIVATTSLAILLYRDQKPLPVIYRVFDRNNPSLGSVYDRRFENPSNRDELEIRRLDGRWLRIQDQSWITDEGRTLIHPMAYVYQFARLLLGPQDAVLLGGPLSPEICPLIADNPQTQMIDQHEVAAPCSVDYSQARTSSGHQLIFGANRFPSPEPALSIWKCDMSSAYEIAKLSKSNRFDHASVETFKKGRAWFAVGKHFLCFVESYSDYLIKRRELLSKAVRDRYFEWEYPW